MCCSAQENERGKAAAGGTERGELRGRWQTEQDDVKVKDENTVWDNRYDKGKEEGRNGKGRKGE